MAVSGNFSETVGALTLSANSTIDFAGFVGTLRFCASVARSTTCRRSWRCRILEAMTSTASLLSLREILKQESLVPLRTPIANRS